MHYAEGTSGHRRFRRLVAFVPSRVASGPSAKQRRRGLRRVDRRPSVPDRLVGPGLRRPTGHPRQCGARWVPNRSPRLYAQRTRIDRAGGGVRCRCGPCPPGRWWPTSARSTPAGRPWPSARAWPAGPSPCTWATPWTLTAPSPPPTTPRAPTCPSPTSSAPAPRRSSPYATSGFRYLQIDNPGEPIGRDQVALLTRHAAMPDVARGHLLLLRADARRGVGHVRPLGALHLPGAVHRHPDPGEGPVPVGLGQRVPDGDAGLRRPEPELAGPPRHGPGPGPLLAHHRAGQRGLPQRRRRPELPAVHRPLSRVGVALLPLHRRPGHPGHPLSDLDPAVGLPGRHRSTRRPG